MSVPSHGSAPLLRLAGVSKTYPNGTTALDAFDLAVDRGEFVSLIGPSGCGKSTVLRLVAGLAEPTGGRIDRGADAVRPGFVFQDATLMPWASVSDNVWLPLRLQGVSRAEAAPAVRDALTRVGLETAAARRPQELSGGMRMRVSIARALVGRPRLLLMDEPFAALDEITRARLNDDLLGLIASLGTTVVFVTHSVYESVYLSSRVVVMASGPGRIVATLPVPAPPGPRTPAFRASATYLETCRAATDALGLAMARPAAA